jgi:HPt (histidine-containing phosphotransfer) domain-containing protein
MDKQKTAQPKIVTHDDYTVITPDTTKLRKSIRASIPGERDPVSAAEQALTTISNDFKSWMRNECDRLDQARDLVKTNGLSETTREELYLAAHDIKGDSGTFGYPQVSPAADSLCRLLELTPDLTKIPLSVIDQHVDAVRAIVREHSRSDIADISASLTAKLCTVTDEFLIKENQHRPEILKIIQERTVLVAAS